MTLEEYLASNVKNGIIDFSIRANTWMGQTEFYIHPSGKDGQTVDYIVFGNELHEKFHTE